MTQSRTPNPGTIERNRVERRADAAWTGSLFEGHGNVSVDSQAFTKLPITWASRTGNADGVTSPEELLAAAHASCFSMALSLVLDEAGTPPEQLTVNATCALEQRHDGFRITASILTCPATSQGSIRAASKRLSNGPPNSAQSPER